MAITLLDSASGNYPAGGGDHSVTISSWGLEENDVIVVAQSADTNLASLGLYRDQGYTVPVASGTSPGRLLAYKRMGSTPDTVINFNDGSADHCYVIQAWRGVDSTTLLDVASPAEATGASDSPNSAGVTTTTDGALVITIFMMDDDDSTVSTTPTGYSNMIEANTGNASTSVGATVGMASKIVSTAAAEDPGAWTISSADAWAAHTLVLRPAVAVATPTITSVGPGALDHIFDNELRVEINGTDFGASQGTGSIELHDTNPLTTTPATSVTQTVRSWSDTQIVIDVDKGALTSDTVWLGISVDASTDDDSLDITCEADPGSQPVARGAIPNTLFTSGQELSIDTSTYFHHAGIQDVLTWTASGLPTGLSISANGIISGTVAAGAAGSSPYAVTITATDLDGNFADDAVTWTVTAPTPDPPTESPSYVRRRGPRSNFGRMGRL